MPPTLSIIGPGRVGKTIGRVLASAGIVSLLDILARSPEKGADASRFIGAGHAISQWQALRSADVYLLAVPDDQIDAACKALVASLCLRPGAVVFHCSGALTCAVLAAARDSGAAVASVHPVRSFADPAKVAADFAGTSCGVEGDVTALSILVPLFDAVGARMIGIEAAHKTLYHAAAVFASNYLVTLVDVAIQSYGQAGIAPEAALQMIAPLLRETADNALRLGPAAALTGPVARGDWQTVAHQQQALAAWNPGYARLYAQLAEATAALAARDEP